MAVGDDIQRPIEQNQRVDDSVSFGEQAEASVHVVGNRYRGSTDVVYA